MTASFTFRRIAKNDVTSALLEECAALFSAHYGRWADDHPNDRLRSQPIKLTPERISKYLTEEGWIATARTADESLVGYAIAAWIRHGSSTISWVTQLIVHPEFRRQWVASRLLSSIWGHSDHFAWGLASANPFAIRALEKVTRRPCSPRVISEHEKARDRALNAVDYLKGREVTITDGMSIINTQFCQDLSSLNEMIEKAKGNGTPWSLGNLPPCHEWLGMTFRPQDAREWTQEEFKAFLNTSSEIVAQAYERMAGASPEQNHPWADPSKADAEINYLVKITNLTPVARILDFGCGSGRHAIALARMGFQVTGVDRSKTAIDRAIKVASGSNDNRPHFILDDILRFEQVNHFDVGLCLYDVIGSYPDERLNRDIFERLLRCVKPNGWIIFSVMSYDYVEQKAKIYTNGEIQRHIASLPPSNLMEKSGEIFDPEHMIVDKQMKLVLRKEQFHQGNDLPDELLVADRRYTINDLRELCKGRVDVHRIGYVRAGQFHLVDEDHKEPLKEILVIGRKLLI